MYTWSRKQMTYQRDPDGRRKPTDYIRRNDGTWSLGGILAGLAALAVVVVLIFSFAADRHPDDPTTNTSGTSIQPKTTPMPSPTPPAATPAKPQ
jgi:hypothetical protein